MQNDPATLNISEPVNQLQSANALLDTSFKKSQGSAISKELRSLDTQRDNSLKCLSNVCNGFMYHHKSEVQKAAELLTKTMDKYGEYIYSMNYQAETSTIDNLLKEIEDKPALSQAAQTLHLQDVVDELQRVNTLFNQRYLARVTETAGDDSVSTTELVKTAKAHYGKLTDFIGAYAVISPSEALNTLISQLNELIEQYNAMVEKRSNKPEEDEPLEEDDEGLGNE